MEALLLSYAHPITDSWCQFFMLQCKSVTIEKIFKDVLIFGKNGA